jgi:flagellar FliL protein
MLILSSKKASELAPREGKEALAEEIRESINGVIGETPTKGKKAADEPIKEVLFTSFIIQ